MTSRTMAAVLTLVLASAAGAAEAADENGRTYIAVTAIGTHSELNGVDTNGFAGSSEIEDDSDQVAGIGAILGYHWMNLPIRTEVEAHYRFRFDFNARDHVSGATVDYESNVSSMAVLVNAAWEWRNDSDWTPYIGGTVGWVRNNADTTRTVLSTQAKQSQDVDSDNFAWGAMLGVDWALSESWAVGLGYRFIVLGDVDTGTFSGGDSVTADHYLSHDIILSGSYRF